MTTSESAMLYHPQITDDSGAPIPFHLQFTIDFVLWLRAEVRKSQAMREGAHKGTQTK